jgi:glucosamine kinase
VADWVLGLDGGGTKTALAVAHRDARVLPAVFGAGINPFDQPRWREELRALLERSPVNPHDLAHSSFGLPGYGESETVNAEQLRVVQDWTGERCTTLNDVAVAFTGALGGGSGVLVLAGTGSMAWGEHGEHQVRVGGWGEAFGDEGSAHWIGRRALQTLSWTLDARLEDDEFRDAMLNAIGVNAAGLIDWTYGLPHPRSSIAALSKHVDALARHNATALGMLREAADHLAMLARAAHAQLGLPIPARFGYAGGVFASPFVREALDAKLETLGGLEAPQASPLAGALFDAAHRAGWAVSTDWLTTVHSSLERTYERD